MCSAAEQGDCAALCNVLLTGSNPNASRGVKENIVVQLSYFNPDKSPFDLYKSSSKVTFTIGGDLNVFDINISNTGDAPLARAAKHGQVEAIALLLAAGAELEQADALGEPPLIKAAQHGHLNAVIYLLGPGLS